MSTLTLVDERFQLTFAESVLDLADHEAALIGMDRTQFLRALISLGMGQLPIARPAFAPARSRLALPKRVRTAGAAPSKHKTRQLILGLYADQSRWIRQSVWALGGMAYSHLLSYLILDWAGINPLTLPPATPAVPAPGNAPGPATTLIEERFQTTFADEVLDLLKLEGALIGMDHGQFARVLVHRRMGKLPLSRPPHAPVRQPLVLPRKRPGREGRRRGPQLSTTKVPLGFQKDQSVWLRETTWQLGGMAYAQLLSYLILDWCEINPLTRPREPITAAG
jgi:hypothetical protein